MRPASVRAQAQKHWQGEGADTFGRSIALRPQVRAHSSAVWESVLRAPLGIVGGCRAWSSSSKCRQLQLWLPSWFASALVSPSARVSGSPSPRLGEKDLAGLARLGRHTYTLVVARSNAPRSRLSAK